MEDKKIPESDWEAIDASERKDNEDKGVKSRFENGLFVAAGMVELNMLFLLTSIPIFTIGAGYTAMYVTIHHAMEDRGTSIHRTYFEKFKENFKQSTLIWIIGMILFAIFASDYYFALTGGIGGLATVLSVLAGIGILLTSFVMLWSLALTGLFENTLGKTVSNGLFISLKNAPRSFAMTILSLSPLLSLWWAPDKWSMELLLLVLLWAAAIAYCNVTLTKDVFARYMGQDETSTEEKNREEE